MTVLLNGSNYTETVIISGNAYKIPDNSWTSININCNNGALTITYNNQTVTVSNDQTNLIRYLHYRKWSGEIYITNIHYSEY